MVLDAGDFLFRSNVSPTMPDNLRQKAMAGAGAVIEGFSLMKYDAVGIGNDDLVMGVDTLRELLKKGALPIVVSNVIPTDGRPIGTRYLIKETAGLRWGIFGMIGMIGNAVKSPYPQSENVNWRVESPLQIGREVMGELRGEKIDGVILLADMEWEELRGLLVGLRGITLVVAGHSTRGLRTPVQVEGTVVVRTYGWGRHVGRLDLFIKDPTLCFYDQNKIQQMSGQLAQVSARVKAGDQSLLGVRKNLEEQLKGMRGGNYYENTLVLLSRQLREDPKVKRVVDEYNRVIKRTEKECPDE